MFQYRIALAQMRRGASEREIARSHCMGRHKLADLRALAEQHGWLDAQAPLPEDAEIAAALGTPKLAASTVSTLEAHRERIAGWLDQGVNRSSLRPSMVPFNLVAAGSNMPKTGGSITPEGDTRLVIGGAHTRLLGLLGRLGFFGVFLGGWLARRLSVHNRLGWSCLVLGRVGRGGVRWALLALARQALLDLVHRLEGALDALFAFGGRALTRRTHAPGSSPSSCLSA